MRAPGSAAGTPADGAVARVVDVYNWADYVDPTALREFTAATGIRVNYDTYDSQEMLETELLAGGSGYDVVVVGGNFLERLVPAAVFRELDQQQLPGRANLDPRLMAIIAQFDPGNAHAVGYTWGTVGIGYDDARVGEPAPDAPLDSWPIRAGPALLQRLAGCGVSVIDSPSDVIAAVLASLGFDADRPAPAQLAAAERVLLAMRPYVRKVDAGSQINDLAGGSICLLVTWNTNVHVARTRAVEAGVAADFHYVVPREGSVAWFDTLAIPADAPPAGSACIHRVHAASGHCGSQRELHRQRDRERRGDAAGGAAAARRPGRLSRAGVAWQAAAAACALAGAEPREPHLVALQDRAVASSRPDW